MVFDFFSHLYSHLTDLEKPALALLLAWTCIRQHFGPDGLDLHLFVSLFSRTCLYFVPFWAYFTLSFFFFVLFRFAYVFVLIFFHLDRSWPTSMPAHPHQQRGPASFITLISTFGQSCHRLLSFSFHLHSLRAVCLLIAPYLSFAPSLLHSRCSRLLLPESLPPAPSCWPFAVALLSLLLLFFLSCCLTVWSLCRFFHSTLLKIVCSTMSVAWMFYCPVGLCVVFSCLKQQPLWTQPYSSLMIFRVLIFGHFVFTLLTSLSRSLPFPSPLLFLPFFLSPASSFVQSVPRAERRKYTIQP